MSIANSVPRNRVSPSERNTLFRQTHQTKWLRQRSVPKHRPNAGVELAYQIWFSVVNSSKGRYVYPSITWKNDCSCLRTYACEAGKLKSGRESTLGLGRRLCMSARSLGTRCGSAMLSTHCHSRTNKIWSQWFSTMCIVTLHCDVTTLSAQHLPLWHKAHGKDLSLGSSLVFSRSLS
jgi:hypothetical protein